MRVIVALDQKHIRDLGRNIRIRKHYETIVIKARAMINCALGIMS